MNIFVVEVELLQLNTKTRLPEACFWKAREAYCSKYVFPRYEYVMLASCCGRA